MADYTITTTAAEEIALKPVMSNKQTWLENAIQERARISGDSIITDLINIVMQMELQLLLEEMLNYNKLII